MEFPSIYEQVEVEHNGKNYQFSIPSEDASYYRTKEGRQSLIDNIKWYRESDCKVTGNG